MISFKNIIILALIAIKTAESACPPDISPCKCYDASTDKVSQVRCGDLVKELTTEQLAASLNKLSGNFGILYIHSTNIVKIGPGIVKNATFDKIFIENNADLTEIDVLAFGDTVQPITLAIRNNLKFEGKDVFEIAKSHGNKLVDLELDHNSIGDIPNDALNGAVKKSLTQLKFIRLNNQNPKTRMTKIGHNAFANLPNLNQLSLDDNSIAVFGDPTNLTGPAIDLLAVNTPAQHVSIFLNKNPIPSEQLVDPKIKLPTQGSVGLVLEENTVQIDLAKTQELFAAIVTNPKGKVYLHNTNPNAQPLCDCAVLDPKLQTNIWGVTKCKSTTGPEVTLEQCI